MKKLVVIVFVVMTGCWVGQDSQGKAGVRASERCEGAGSAYAGCVAEVTENRDTCYAGCAADSLKCVVEAAVGGVTGLLPCVGPIMASVTTSCSFCAKEPLEGMLGCVGKCAYDIFDTYVRHPGRFKTEFLTCAAGNSDVVLESFVKELWTGLGTALVEGATCALAYGVCTSIDKVGPFELGSCDTQFTSQVEACETAQCNPAYCTCFDAQECPTIGGGASTTHMTGTVLCDSISGGSATDAAGNQVACISYKNNAEERGEENCTETGYNPDGSFGGRGRFEACDNDSHCGDDGEQVFQCMDYDCDGQPHCDYAELGGDGNCCEHHGPRDVGCQEGYACLYDEDFDRRMCFREEETPGPGI